MSMKIEVKNYALDELREYLIYNDITVASRDDLIKVYSDMYDKGYFFKAYMNDKMDEVKSILNDFANAYEKNKDILEKELIFFGSRRVLEKMESMKVKK